MLIRHRLFPPLPPHEQVVVHRQMPTWWHQLDGIDAKFTQEEKDLARKDREEKAKAKGEAIPLQKHGRVLIFVRAPGTPDNPNPGKVKIGMRQRRIMEYMEANQSRWVTFREIGKAAVCATDTARLLVALVKAGFLDKRPDPIRPKVLSKHHPFKYKFLVSLQDYIDERERELNQRSVNTDSGTPT